MSELDTRALRALVDAMPNEEWASIAGVIYREVAQPIRDLDLPKIRICVFDRAHYAKAVVALRNAAPALLDEVDALRAEVREQSAIMADMRSDRYDEVTHGSAERDALRARVAQLEAENARLSTPLRPIVDRIHRALGCDERSDDESLPEMVETWVREHREKVAELEREVERLRTGMELVACMIPLHTDAGVNAMHEIGRLLHGTPTAEATDPTRCEMCGWPLAESRDQGCVAGDCSYRPEQGSDEWYRVKARRKQIAAAKEMAAGRMPSDPTGHGGFEWKRSSEHSEHGFTLYAPSGKVAAIVWERGDQVLWRAGNSDGLCDETGACESTDQAKIHAEAAVLRSGRHVFFVERIADGGTNQ